MTWVPCGFFRYFEYFVITPDAQGCKSGISWIIVRDHLFVENKQKNIIWTLVQGISGWLLDYHSSTSNTDFFGAFKLTPFPIALNRSSVYPLSGELGLKGPESRRQNTGTKFWGGYKF